jgi:hypothetical protein
MTSADDSWVYSSWRDADSALPCPLCGQGLQRAPQTTFEPWFCPNAHGYSTVATLLAELREADIPLLPDVEERAARATTAAEWDCGLVDTVLASQPWWTETSPAHSQAVDV